MDGVCGNQRRRWTRICACTHLLHPVPLQHPLHLHFAPRVGRLSGANLDAHKVGWEGVHAFNFNEHIRTLPLLFLFRIVPLILILVIGVAVLVRGVFPERTWIGHKVRREGVEDHKKNTFNHNFLINVAVDSFTAPFG